MRMWRSPLAPARWINTVYRVGCRSLIPYVVERDRICKGFLRGEVHMFHTFVVGSGAEDCAVQQQESDGEIEDCSAPNTPTPV